MTTDTPLLFFWVITVILVYLAIGTSKPSYWYLAGIGFGLGMLSKYTMVLLLPSLLIFLLLTKRERIWLLKKEPYIGLPVQLL